jgi:acyl-coenzyme A synthetase/AMP-(fatty) acid ligase
VNGAGFLAAFLGARRIGLVPVLADWASPSAERDRVAAALGVAAHIACGEVFPTGSVSFRAEARCGVPAVPPEGAAFVKLTSGSSGTPSGVAISAEALAADDDQLAAAMSLRSSDRFVAAIPWSHSYGLSSLVMPALRRGSLLIVPSDSSPWGALESARALSATVFPTVPVYLQTLAGLAAPPEWPTTLRTVISAGAPLSPETASRFRETFGRDAHVFYGASESGGITYDRDGGAALRGTVGTPIDGVDVTLDDDGVVAVRSEALGLRRVPLQDERLVGGVFRSADLGAWTESGELQLLGRADALINVGGKKVHPAEVESVLRAMPGVRDAFVLGIPAAGDERAIVRAFVACDPASLSYAAVASWCRERLSGHKVPRSIVRLREIPRTDRGKVDRAALADLTRAPEHCGSRRSSGRRSRSTWPRSPRWPSHPAAGPGSPGRSSRITTSRSRAACGLEARFSARTCVARKRPRRPVRWF